MQAWIQDAALKLKPHARAMDDAADDGALLLAERGRSDAPASETVKLAPSRGRPAVVPGAHRGGQVVLPPLDPEVSYPRCLHTVCNGLAVATLLADLSMLR